MQHDDSKTSVTHLYLITDSPDCSDALYELVNDLIAVGWEICGPERTDCFVHLAAVSIKQTRLAQILWNNLWLRAFAFRQPLDPDVDRPWVAHLEFGAYGGHATKTLPISREPDSDEDDSVPRIRPKYDSGWLEMPPVFSNSATSEETGGVATVSARDRSTIRFRLTFHGLPDEAERCLALATVMLAEHNVAAECYASGNDRYQAVEMSFETSKEPALRVFNRLAAQVPAATIVLEYEDPATGKPLTLRAVDGKIDHGHSR